MFGGTRGKFNAMDLLSDREERQRMRGGGMMGGSGGRRMGGRALNRRGSGSSDYSVIQDFGSVRDWNARKAGQGRTDMDFEEDMAIRRRRDRGGRRRRRDSRRRNIDRRAEEYDRFLVGGLGGDEYMDMDDDYMPPMAGRRSSRRRKGFAYKYNTAEDLFDDDGEYIIDVEPKYATERDLDMARAMSPKRRRRSWEERAIEMDRVPPRGAVAWGPNGRIGSGEDPLDRAAMEALRDIKKSKKYLDRKEDEVDELKDGVVNLKADASYCENQLENARGREANKLEQELGFILEEVEEASRNLRMARAERDVASDRVSDLEERNWALLSEYEAARSFEEDIMD
ncbi:hypothetical protein ACHAXR_004010 [Thalassiosira sp. AJA248-18]